MAEAPSTKTLNPVEQARSLIAKGKCVQALEICSAELTKGETADLWFTKAQAFNWMGKYPEALECCEKALSLDQNNSAILDAKGNILSELGRLPEAIKVYTRAIILNPDSERILTNAASAYREAGDLHKASALAVRAAAINHDYVPVYVELGLIATAEGDHVRAEKHFETAISQAKPDSCDYYIAVMMKGEALVTQTKYDEAIKAFDSALKMQNISCNSGAANKKGFALYLKGDYAEAMHMFERAMIVSYELTRGSAGTELVENADTAVAHFGKGCIFQAKKDYQSALEEYAHAVRIAPHLEAKVVPRVAQIKAAVQEQMGSPAGTAG